MITYDIKPNQTKSNQNKTNQNKQNRTLENLALVALLIAARIKWKTLTSFNKFCHSKCCYHLGFPFILRHLLCVDEKLMDVDRGLQRW